MHMDYKYPPNALHALNFLSRYYRTNSEIVFKKFKGTSNIVIYYPKGHKYYSIFEGFAYITSDSVTTITWWLDWSIRNFK